MNKYDSLKIVDILITKFNNFILTNSVKDADILLLNTCSIREKAQEKLFHQLGRWRILKKKNPSLIICVGGCVASQESNFILNRANYVDIIFGPQSLHFLPEMIINVYKNNVSIINVNFYKNEKFNITSIQKNIKYSAYVSIMEGCNKYCSFCVVPYTRGKEISRPCLDIVSEITKLVNKGVKEITLLGQNVNSYFGKFYNNIFFNFSDLLFLISKINGVERIRYLTSHPSEFTEDLINAYLKIPKLVSFVHLPIQSGSDKILNLMKRGYSVSYYKSIIYRLRKVRPNIQISSDFIVGFPGETEFDFNQTLNLIYNIDFDMSFSFIYSPRPGTPAANIKCFINNKIKKKRLYLLQSIILKQMRNYTLKMVGTIQRILIEGYFKNNKFKLYGRTENNRIVILNNEINLTIGEFVYVKIISYNKFLNAILFKI